MRICFSIGSVEQKGFEIVIESTSLPSGRINNPLSLVMDVSLSCSARIPGPCGRLFQSDTDQGPAAPPVLCLQPSFVTAKGFR